MSFGIPTPDRSLLGNIPAWIAFGMAFYLGWLVHRCRALLTIWQQRWAWNLALAIVMTLASLAFFNLVPPFRSAEKNGLTLLYAMLYSIGVWSWSFALIGIGLRFMSRFSQPRRYLADASYWVYLIHLPIVMALQVMVAKWPGSAIAKFAFILVIGLAVMLLSYQWLVRGRAIGALLNGRSKRAGTL